MTTVAEFEEAVWNVEGIRIIVRERSWAKVDPYNYTNTADKGISITKYLKTRVNATIGDYEVVVIGGDGVIVHGNTLLSKVRASYSSE